MPASFKRVGEGEAGELPALIGVEDVGPAVTGDRLLQRRNAEVGVHRVRQPPGEDLAAGPVHDRHQVQEAAPHRDVGHIRTPDLVRLLDASDGAADTDRSCAADAARSSSDAGRSAPSPSCSSAAGRDGARRTSPADADAAPSAASRTTGVSRNCSSIRRINLSVLFALRRRLPVERRARDRYQLALAHDREPWMTGFDHRLPPIQAQRSKALAKKSRSTTS